MTGYAQGFDFGSAEFGVNFGRYIDSTGGDQFVAQAANTLSNEIHPIDDMRSTADYRRAVAVNLLRRFWADTTS